MYEYYMTNKIAKLFDFQVELKDGITETDDLSIIASTNKYFNNEDDPSNLFVFNKTNKIIKVEKEEIENPNTGIDEKSKYISYIISSVVLIILIFILNKNKLFKKI